MKNAYNGGHLGLRLHLSAPKVQHLMKSQEAVISLWEKQQSSPLVSKWLRETPTFMGSCFTRHLVPVSEMLIGSCPLMPLLLLLLFDSSTIFFAEMRLIAYNIILLQVVRLFYLFITNDETQPLTPLSEGFLGKARLALHVSCLLMIRASCYISSKLPSLKYCMI